MNLSDLARRLDQEAHVWLLPTDARPAPAGRLAAPIDSARLDALSACLSENERERASDFRSRDDRAQFIQAHAFLRWVLSRYLTDRQSAGWDFVIGPYGRPELAESELRWLRFNLSHTAGLVAVAVTRDTDCGVDVERRDKRRNFLGMSRTAFSEREQAHVRQIPEDQRQARFYQIWCLKEAYIKAIGMGLSQPLHQFSFELDDASAIAFEPAPKRPPQDWQFYLGTPSPVHQLALALGAAPTSGVRLFDVSPELAISKQASLSAAERLTRA